MKKRVKSKKKLNLVLLIFCFFITYLVAFIGSLFTMKSVNTLWYVSIRPTITPPNWVFPIAWSFLFFLMAVSLFLVLNSTKDKLVQRKIWIVFGINFLLNILWSVLYFGLRNPTLAFVEIFFLEISVLSIIFVTWKINKISAWLIVPYSLWIGFAAILNYLSAFG